MKLNIGTFNIQHGRNHVYYLEHHREIIDLDGVAEVIRSNGIEICGLNEVRNQEGNEGFCNQAKAIAERLGYHFAFAKAIDLRVGEYGNALVSKYPIESVRAVAIPAPEKEMRTGTEGYEDRVLLVAQLRIEKCLLTVLVCHFGLNPDEMQSAIGTVRKELATVDTPIVLMGDFNFTSDSEYYSALTDVLKDTAIPSDVPLTWPSHSPAQKIDYILVSDSVTVETRWSPETMQSDHRPYFLTVTL